MGEEIDVSTFHNEIFSRCHVVVDQYFPKVSYTNIGTDGISSCHFYLLLGKCKDDKFCFLDHDTIVYKNISSSDYIYSILSSFVTELSKNFVGSEDDTIKNLNNLHLMVGGGSKEEKEENDIVRKSFSLLVNPDAKTVNNLKAFCNDTNIDQLLEKLINNITILKAVSYETSNSKEYQSMNSKNQADIIDVPSLTVYYDLVSDSGFIVVDWGKPTDVFNIAYMNFQLRSTIGSECVWNLMNKEIEKIKNKFDHQSNEFKEFEKALSYIPNNAVITDFSPYSINDDL